MANELIPKVLKPVIENNKINALDMCEAVWDYIQKQDSEQGFDCFKEFLIYVDLDALQLENVEAFLSRDLAKKVSENTLQIENRVVSSLIKQNKSEECFYRELWNKIHDESLFSEKEGQVGFLFCIWLDTRNPYYQIPDSCEMQEEEFAAALQELKPLLKKANFYIYRGSLQQTQRASLLMALADGIEDDRKKAVFWADVMRTYAFNYYYQRKKREQKKQTE